MDSGPSIGDEAEGHAAVPQEWSKADEQVALTVPDGSTSHQAAEQIIGQARGEQGQAPAPATKAEKEFQRFNESRSPAAKSGTGLSSKPAPTAIDKAKNYLEGLQAGDSEEFRRNFLEYAKNVDAANQKALRELDQYAIGFLEGFFIDGALGNFTGLYEAGKMAINFAWWATSYSISVGYRMAGGGNFSAEEAFVAKAEEYVTMAYEITQVVGTELGEQAFSHYQALAEGTPEQLRALGDTHQQVAAVMLGIAAELSKLPPIPTKIQGQISGAITWEILQTVVELLFSGGLSKTVTGTAKFAHIASKLGDFGKYASKFGDYAHTVAKIFKGNIRFSKFCERLDVFIDGTRAVANFFCFTRDTLIATDLGLKVIGEIQPGDRVQSFDFARGEWTLGEVTKRHDNSYTGRMITVHVGRTKIEATAGHPFWVLAGEDLEARALPRELDEFEDEGKSLPGRWVNSHELRAGDLVIGVDGDHRRIDEVTIRDEAEVAVSNLTVRGCHSYAVGPLAILVHNGPAFCDVYKKALSRLAEQTVDAATKAALNARMAASPLLLQASKAAGDVAIHAHHIVLKTVSWTDRWFKRSPFIEQAQKILKDVDIPLLGKTDDFGTKVKEVDDLANMTLALNGGGVHSYDYCKKVAELLQLAYDSASSKAGKRAAVLGELQRMADILSQGNKFW